MNLVKLHSTAMSLLKMISMLSQVTFFKDDLPNVAKKFPDAAKSGAGIHIQFRNTLHSTSHRLRIFIQVFFFCKKSIENSF